LCDNYKYGAFGDWFLPSKEELNLMYLNLASKGLGSFSQNYYWSSTEVASVGASVQNFKNGQKDIMGVKNESLCNVRAIRAF
jgi:hypothetical protein